MSARARPHTLAGPGAALQRMRQRAQFDAVLACVAVAKTAHFALHFAGAGAGDAPGGAFPGGGRWIGVMLPKRWAKRAVTRNLMRRQIYAISRHVADTLPCCPMVVRLRRGFSAQHFLSAGSDALKLAVRQELLTLFGSVRHA